MKKLFASAALAVATLGITAGAASADTVDNHAPHSTAPVGIALINGDVQALNNVHVLDGSCVAPWKWSGPISVLNDDGAYQACQAAGGVQTDAPAVDLSQHTLPLPIPVG